MTYDDKLTKAISKLEAMNTHHPAMVLYSEAKFLYTLLPELIDLLKMVRSFNLDSLNHPDDLDAHEEFINLINKMIPEEVDSEQR